MKLCFFHPGQLRLIRRSLTNDTTHALVRALVHSRLDYCNGVLAGLPINKVTQLQSIRRASARLSRTILPSVVMCVVVDGARSCQPQTDYHEHPAPSMNNDINSYPNCMFSRKTLKRFFIKVDSLLYYMLPKCVSHLMIKKASYLLTYLICIFVITVLIISVGASVMKIHQELRFSNVCLQLQYYTHQNDDLLWSCTSRLESIICHLPLIHQMTAAE